jgi:hypothetical protein
MDAPEAPEAPATSDYIRDALSQATSQIPESKYLNDDGGPDGEPEKKDSKKATPTKQPLRGKSDAKPDAKAEEDDFSDIEEPPEETDEDKEENQADSKEAKTQAAWTTYKQAYRELPKIKAELTELKAQLAKAGDTREVEGLRQAVQHFQQERDQLMRAVEVGNIEQSPHWQHYVTEPLNRMWGDVQEIAKRNNLEPNKLVNFLVNRDDVGLNEYMAEARPGDKYHAFGMIRDLGQIEHTKTEMRKNAHQLQQNDQAQYSAYREQQMKQIGEERSRAIEKIMPKIEDKVMRYFPKDKRIDLASATKHIMDHDSWSNDVKMYSGFAALVLPELLDTHRATRIALKAAKEELVKLRGGGPKINSGHASSPRRAQVESDADDEAEFKKPIREYTFDAARRMAAAAGFRQR